MLEHSSLCSQLMGVMGYLPGTSFLPQLKNLKKILEIFPDLWYSIKQVGRTGRFRLIMVKPIIDELAMLKESLFNVKTPKGGSLPGYRYYPITELIREYRS